MFRISSLLLASSFFLACFYAQALPKPLFQKGSERFRLVDAKGKTPVFHVLTSNPTKQAIALAVNSALRLASPESSKPSVEIRLETLQLEPTPGHSKELSLRLEVSGRNLDLDVKVSRIDLEAGKAIKVNLPPKSQEVQIFQMTTRGGFVLQYKKALDILFINNALIKVDLDSPLGDGESESLQFNVQGIRQL